MRLTVLFLLALLAGTGVAAQETDAGSVALPIHGPRPTDVVARLARRAMATPSDSAAWKALAEALPELALIGSADHAGTFAAARLADSLSASGPMIPASGAAAGPPSSPTPPLVLGAIPPMLRTGALGLLAVMMTTIVVWRFRPRPESVQDRPSTTQAGRLWTAQTLASGGVHVPEIARRMGIAQEAVTLALRMAGTDTVTASRRPASSPTQPPRTEAQIRMRREILAGVGRLRDQRLTYGGGSA